MTLSELPDEGRLFIYDNEDSQLNQGLGDLIGSHEYELRFFIQPIGRNTYELRGSLKTQMKLLCSLCAHDLKWEINENLNEILFVESDKRPRTSKEVRVNHASEFVDQNLFCNILSSEEFSVLDFAHEIIALAEPSRPLGSADCEKNLCPNLTTESRLKLAEIQGQNPTSFSPFSTLAKIKMGPFVPSQTGRNSS